MNPIIAHGGHVAPPSAPTLTLVGALAGLFATAVMNVPMHRQREGKAPPFVAASLLADRPVSEVSAGLASAIHYGSGVLGGALFALLAVALRGVLPSAPAIPGTALPLAPHVAAGAAVLVLRYLSFASLVLPAATDWDADRVALARNAWAGSVTVYAVALLAFVPLVVVVLV